MSEKMGKQQPAKQAKVSPVSGIALQTRAIWQRPQGWPAPSKTTGTDAHRGWELTMADSTPRVFGRLYAGKDVAADRGLVEGDYKHEQ